MTDRADEDMSICDWFGVDHGKAIPASDEHILRLHLLASEVEWLVDLAMVTSCGALHPLEGEWIVDFLGDCGLTLECFVFVHRLHLWASRFLLGRKVGKHR